MDVIEADGLEIAFSGPEGRIPSRGLRVGSA
jgi:hypothetical protein